MKYAIRIALLIIIAVLSYLTFDTVYSDIKYEEEVAIKEAAVIKKLELLRDGQIAYKDEKGKFASTFPELLDFMENGQMRVLIQSGDKDDSTTVFKTSEMMVSIKDSLFSDVDIPQLKYVPFHDTLQFKMAASEIKKNAVTVPVFEIIDPKPFSKERQKKKEPLKVGSIFEVNYNGNWDK
ncbi:MAG TPA: hypothetical protein DCY51_01880 [Bacteroidetes bacterium]|nr:hypothetical protein [Bacteroidota bacterium]